MLRRTAVGLALATCAILFVATQWRTIAYNRDYSLLATPIEPGTGGLPGYTTFHWSYSIRSEWGRLKRLPVLPGPAHVDCRQVRLEYKYHAPAKLDGPSGLLNPDLVLQECYVNDALRFTATRAPWLSFEGIPALLRSGLAPAP